MTTPEPPPPTRPFVSSWWNAGGGVWSRYYGRFTLTVRKHGVGHYVVTVVDGGDTTTRTDVVLQQPSGTLSGAKRAGELWVRDHQ